MLTKRRNSKCSNPTPGSLAARVAFGTLAPGATLALTAADIVDAVDQGLLDEAAGVVLKPMEMGGELVGRVVNPLKPTKAYVNATRLRLIQDFLLMLTDMRNLPRSLHIAENSPIKLSMLTRAIYPEWESTMLTQIRDFAKDSRVGVPDFQQLAQREAARTVTKEWAEENPGPRRNPESAAATLYEKFHQTPSTEVVELAETIHEHDYLTTLGTLQTIKLHTLADKQVEIAFADDRPYLCSNETGTQLYIAGGDQTMDLKALGMGSKLWHKEHMLLGICLEVTYQTKKGFHDFQLTDYYHELGEETGVQPMLAYDTRNCKLSILGGQYQIKPEGITN